MSETRAICFEIPLSDVEAAKADGYRDLLEHERGVGASPVVAVARPQRIVPHVAPVTVAAKPELPNADPASSLAESIDREEQEAEEERLRREQELEEAEGVKYYMVLLNHWFADRKEMIQREMGTHGISIAIHVAILLILASLFLPGKEKKGLVLEAGPAMDEETIEEVVLEPELDITDPTEVTESEAPPEAAEVEMAMTEAVTVPNFMAAISGQAAKPPGEPSKDPGNGIKVSKKKSSVFGTKTTATDYVFVIDNSNSMQRGRFETALNELMIAVNGLNKKQRFYVIFYSDTAYGMMYPNPVTNLVYATEPNKQKLYAWLTTIQLCLKTNGREALQAAFDFKPDVIYVLGDGAFTDGAARYFSEQSKSKTVLHTRGMEVSPGNAKQFAALAKNHGGTYMDVGVAPGAVQLWQRNPRPRNNKSNGVWGITLKK